MSDEREKGEVLQVWLPRDTAALVKRLSAEEGMSVSTWIRVIILRVTHSRPYWVNKSQ